MQRAFAAPAAPRHPRPPPLPAPLPVGLALRRSRRSRPRSRERVLERLAARSFADRLGSRRRRRSAPGRSAAWYSKTPLRSRTSPNSTDAVSHASSIHWNRFSATAGRFGLPERSPLSARSTASASDRGSDPSCWSSAAHSPSASLSMRREHVLDVDLVVLRADRFARGHFQVARGGRSEPADECFGFNAHGRFLVFDACCRVCAPALGGRRCAP